MPKPFELMQLNAAQSGAPSSGEYFIKDGIDYKGQVQYAYTMNGKGASFEVKIDPGKLIGLTAAVGVKVSALSGKEVMVFAIVGPQKIAYKFPNAKNPKQLEERNVTLAKPIALGSMQGTFWEGKAGASFEVGVSMSAHAGISRGGATVPSGDDGDSAAGRAELAAASFEASAGFKADATYTYANAALEDMSPRLYGVDVAGADKAALKKAVTELFGSGSTKDALKTGAVAFMNERKDVFGEQSKTGFFGVSNRSSQDLVDALKSGGKKIGPKTPNADSLLSCTENWAAMLQPYCGGFDQKGLCILVLSSHKPEASAGFSAKVEAKAAIGPLANVGFKLDVKGPTLAGVGKWSSSRFQTYWPLPEEQLLMFTQEAKLNYWQVEVTAVVAEASANASVVDAKGTAAGITSTAQSVKAAAAAKDVTKVDTSKAEVKRIEVVNASGTAGAKKVWNSLTYTSVCAYWTRPANEALIADGSPVTLLQGSGISLGRSTVLANLKLLLTAGWDGDELSGSPAGVKHYLMLSEALQVPAYLLAEAIWSSEVKSLIRDLSSQNAALAQAIKSATPAQAENLRKNYDGGELPLLLEVAFRLPPVALKLEKKGSLPKLDGKFFDNAVNTFNKTPTAGVIELLEALRIRVRMRDLKETAGGFKLGFKLLGQELGIGYDTIDRAGAEGTVDLATYWFNKSKNPVKEGEVRDTSTDKNMGGVPAYEAGVPKVLLFDQ